MGALNYLAYAIMAAMFISMAVVLYTGYSRAMEEQRFAGSVEELANRIRSLAAQDPGTEWHLQIYVPSGCELSFGDSSVNFIIGNRADNVYVGIQVSGPALSGTSANMRLLRVENGVEVSV
ncbi:MAG: hypothetical protein QXG10_00250 [Candidatus Hadarchaeales archaeon]